LSSENFEGVMEFGWISIIIIGRNVNLTS
jgi:hypothetical protein